MGAGTRGRGAGQAPSPPTQLASVEKQQCPRQPEAAGPRWAKGLVSPNTLQGKRAPPSMPWGSTGRMAGSAEGKVLGIRQGPRELGRKVPCQVSALAEGALWAALPELLAFALPSPCQRHRQRGPWYPAEGPSPHAAELYGELGEPRFSCGYLDGQYPTLAVSGRGTRSCPVYSTPHGSSPLQQEGVSLRSLRSCPRSSCLDRLKDVESCYEAWESGRDPGVSTSRVSWALLQDPGVFEGPRSLQGRPGLLSHGLSLRLRGLAPNTARSSPTEAEPRHPAPPGWGSAGRRLGGAAGRGVAQEPRTLPPRPAQWGLGSRPHGPAGDPSEPGWGCILGPLAQRSRSLSGTDSSHFGLTLQRSHKQDRPLTQAYA